MNQDNLASINDPIIDLPVLEDIKIDSNVEFNSPKHHEMLIERDKYQSQLLENIFSAYTGHFQGSGQVHVDKFT